MLFELLGLTKYVRYLDIELMLFEQLGFTNYVHYLDIDYQHYVKVTYVVCET
jgi:hypothetical protein